MKGEGAQPLPEALAAQRRTVVQEWLTRILQAYPEPTARFLFQEKDPFRNPIGHTLKEVLPGLLDALLGPHDVANVRPLLERIVRIQAVQDCTPGQAVGFLFRFKPVLREVWKEEGHDRLTAADLTRLESRIDEMALLAFDLYMECREQMYEIQAKEARRRLYLLERMHGLEPSASPEG